VDSITYSIGNGVAAIVEQLLDVDVANIPSQIEYKGNSYTVTSVGYRGFYNSNVKKVVLPKTVTRLGFDAFRACDSLEIVILSEKISYLEAGVFSYCDKLALYCLWLETGNQYCDKPAYWFVENQEDVPTDGGNYWRYDENGNPVIWE
jgi:hypothetical protein